MTERIHSMTREELMDGKRVEKVAQCDDFGMVLVDAVRPLAKVEVQRED